MKGYYMKKRIILLLFVLLLFTGCGDNGPKEMPKENPIVKMTFEGYGDITLELYPKEAYNTVANFVNLIQDGFYEKGNIIRVQKGFVLQVAGVKNLNYTIKGEFAANGVENNIKHTKGVLSMARAEGYDTAAGQFFIMLGDAAYLDGNYAAFGKVIEGLDVIDKINAANLKVTDNQFNFLAKESYITIRGTSVDTKGYNYKVEKIR
jgi:peptidyl-prolyl cis-trans isomerase B (cyclophilin B)